MSQIQSLLDQGDTLRRQGLLFEAERHYQQALDAATKRIAAGAEYGPEHLAVAECWCKLGRLHQQAGHDAEADRCFHEALDIYQRVEGDEYFELALAKDRIAVP
jgi:tetratricopeptide (TPR) repeat protein